MIGPGPTKVTAGNENLKRSRVARLLITAASDRRVRGEITRVRSGSLKVRLSLDTQNLLLDTALKIINYKFSSCK